MRVGTMGMFLLAVVHACGASRSLGTTDGDGTAGLGGGSGGVTGSGGGSGIGSGGGGGIGSGGGGGSGTGGAGGFFAWSIDGKSLSDSGDCTLWTSADGGSATLRIASDYARTVIPCWMEAPLASAPAAVGTYPIVEQAGSQANNTFVGACSSVYRESTAYADPGVSGTVTLTRSERGLVAGSFEMRARPNGTFAGTGGVPEASLVYTGTFAVICQERRY